MVNILCCYALQHSISEEERLRAVRHVCSALPRTAQALPEQVLHPTGLGCPACPALRVWRNGPVRRRVRVAVTQLVRLAACGGCWL